MEDGLDEALNFILEAAKEIDDKEASGVSEETKKEEAESSNNDSVPMNFDENKKENHINDVPSVNIMVVRQKVENDINSQLEKLSNEINQINHNTSDQNSDYEDDLNDLDFTGRTPQIK